jgi:hypothetical protein
MDRRSDPRFENYTPVRLRPLNRSQFKLECTVVDTSGAGMRIVASENLPEGAIVGLEFRDQIVLASVCQTQAFRNKVVLGVQRVHTVIKGTPLRKKADILQIRKAIEEFREGQRASSGQWENPVALSAAELAQLDDQIREFFEYRRLDPGPKPRRRDDAVKRILDRINRIDRPRERKIQPPGLARLAEACASPADEAPSLAPVRVERRPQAGKCGLPSWFMASLGREQA